MNNNPATRGQLRKREAIHGYLCISPWLIGFALLTFGPIIASLYLSFTDWDMISAAKWTGTQNYARIFADDFRFRQSLKVTAIYAACAVPLGTVLSLCLAMLLNMRLTGMKIFRTMFYLPVVLPGVAVAMVWLTVFKPYGGIFNTLFGWFGMDPIPWLVSAKWALKSFIIMSVWGVGGGMIIFLAALQNVPTQLYEAAELDGASGWRMFKSVTLPMISPTLLFNLVMGVIGSFQVFTTSFIMTQGGPAYATLFYVLYLYQKAFKYLQMGYACALAWILFIVILTLTLLILKSSAKWVYYETDVDTDAGN